MDMDGNEIIDNCIWCGRVKDVDYEFHICDDCAKEEAERQTNDKAC